jgi:glycosyltransferase involved in cell wall biosynthesis
MPPARLAYLTGRYVAPSHTFVVREVAALRELGTEVDTFSIWRSAPDQLLTDSDRAEAARTFDVLPLRPLEVVRSQVAALSASPRAYARLAKRAVRMAAPGLRGRLLGASWAVEALILWRQLRRRGIRHVHAHLNGTAPAVAMLATAFANDLDGSRDHTWSLTVHGPNEFYDVDREALPEKVRSADFAVCISDFARSQLMAFVGEDHWEKLHVVHCGVDPGAYEPAAGSGGDGPLSLLSVGRLTQVKGQAVLIEGLADLRRRSIDAKLTIVGDGPKRADLELMAQRLGVNDSVSFTGAIGQDEVVRHYRAADLYVHGSFAEGIPVVLMEAMAHGLAVVVAGVMGIPELVRDGENGVLVRPGRSDEVAEAIERLAADPGLRARMGEAGRSAVEEEFDVRANAALLQDLFARYAR